MKEEDKSQFSGPPSRPSIRKKRRKHRGVISSLLISILTFGIVYLFLHFPYLSTGNPIKDWKMESSNIEQFHRMQNISAPFYSLLEHPGYLRITTQIAFEPDQVLIFPRISGNRVRIFIDDREIAMLGGLDGTAILWTKFHRIYLPPEFAGPMRKLSVDIYGVYDAGIREIPYLLPARDQIFLNFIRDIFLNKIFWITKGATLILFLVLISYSLINTDNRRAYLFIAGSLFLNLIYIHEFAGRNSSGSLDTYLILRKLLISSGYISTYLLTVGLEWHIKKRALYSKYLSSIAVISTVMILLASSHAELKLMNHIAGTLALIHIFFMMYLAIASRNRIVIFGIGFWIWSMLTTLTNIILGQSHIFTMHFGHIFAMLAISANLLQDYIRIHEQYVRVRKLAEQDYLTGAYNRSILEQLKTGPTDHIALIDLDKFKEVNDRLGHEQGDRVLQEWVSSARQMIRSEDLVIRLGGDEFVIIFRGYPGSVMDRIKKEFSERLGDLSVGFSYGIRRVENTLDEAMRLADRDMYGAKKESRGGTSSWLRRLFSDR